ncbi:AMP-binding enzyme family protein (macronuclear) [Tetrahymena thermophila SB210]|uniref:AMP-binding enzyme family protein n=1 Tax=Tetrahymena thermophila (strain SB210) TaxID=312017 RepID=A4VDY8_TETTS|nr:AMP-binding enzyme family protein [Tetrahymena thermophila SB210]EDK31731.2 AMP-binding enzyme family protein [Tetrahymena thermophila SB210]|eukprot:XP_001471338.2 AMP-binding enzyme family protein [Tetrahymena thermophila SB210]
MNYLIKFDFFSSHFNFYLTNKQNKRGTFQGALISLSILVVVLSYFIYLILQFFNNQIDPKFRSQIFVTDEPTEISLRSDLLAFYYQVDTQYSLDTFQAQNNKTYLVPIAFLIYPNQNNNMHIQLNFTECSSANLQGYKCLDFSNVSNYSLILDGKQNNYSQIYLLFYPCPVIDDFKTTMPDNCANQTEIENLVNRDAAGLNLKLQTSQFNITSQQNQVNYMNKYIFTESNFYVLNTLNIQQQKTKVSKGLIIQSESQYSGPINYNQQNNIFGNKFNQPYIQITLQMDQVVQEISIQYPTLPEILALVNSTFALFLTLGFIFRSVAQKEILKDFFCIFLQNIYQDTYQEALKKNNLFEQKIQNQQIQTEEDQQQQDEINLFEKQSTNNSQLPQFSSKFISFLKQNTLKHINSSNIINQKDEVKETIECNFNNESQISSIENSLQKFTLTQNKKIRQQCDPSKTFYSQNKTQLSLSQIKSPELQKRKFSEGKNLSLKNGNSIKFKEILGEQKNQIKLASSPEDISIQLRNIKDKDIMQKAKRIIFEKRKTKIWSLVKQLWNKIRLCMKKKKIVQDEKNQFQIKKRVIEQQVSEQLNILDLIKDILFIKKSIMILLSKEQLAAIQLAGYSSQYLRYESSSFKNTKQTKFRHKNYLEEQQNILDSCDLQCKYIKKFFQKSQNGNFSELDINHRILSTMNYNQKIKQ